MKVLVDSCVWSLSLRRRSGIAGLNREERLLVSALAEAIRDGRAVIVGPVRQEVLSGIRQVEQFEKLRESLEAFPDEPIEPRDYVQAARLGNLCRGSGVQCGTVDILLCALAERNQWTILTKDAGLLRSMEVIEREHLSKNQKTSGRKLRER